MRTLPLLLALLFALSTQASAQVVVRKDGSEKASIDLSGLTVAGSQATVFFTVLERDLQRSGWFRTVASSGEFRVLGSATDTGRDVVVEIRVYNTGTQRNHLSQRYQHSVAGVRALAHRVADDIVEKVAERKGIASTRIAMIGTRSGAKEIYLSDYDGENMIQLTQDRSVSVAPKWSPDNAHLVYTSFLKRFPDIYQITLATGSRQRISNYAGLNTGPAYSPDGRFLALILSKDLNPELYVRDARSDRLTRLTRTPAAEASPTWSNDGRQIAYVSDQSGSPQIYIVNRDGGAPRRLTLRGSENVAPDWGPTGWIAHSSRIGGKYHIVVTHPETGETRQVSSGFADFEDPSWAPNGRHIVCSRTENYRSALYILDTMGDEPVRLHNISGDWYSPAWSR